jgi:hypothetical protein
VRPAGIANQEHREELVSGLVLEGMEALALKKPPPFVPSCDHLLRGHRPSAIVCGSSRVCTSR